MNTKNDVLSTSIIKRLGQLSHYRLNYSRYNEIRALLDNWEAPAAWSKEDQEGPIEE